MITLQLSTQLVYIVIFITLIGFSDNEMPHDTK